MCMSFFSHQAEVLCNSACNETHSLCVVSHLFQATKTNHGKWVKCDKSCANLWKNQSTPWAKRAAAVRKLRMAGTAKRSTFHSQRYCPVRSELNVHQMWSLKNPGRTSNQFKIGSSKSLPKKIVFHSKKAMMSVGPVMISASLNMSEAFFSPLGFPRNLPLHTLDGLASTSAPWAWIFFPKRIQQAATDGFVETALMTLGCCCGGLSLKRKESIWYTRVLLEVQVLSKKVGLWSMKPFSKTH